MIESLHSPHIARVKALISSKGAKERRESARYVAEGAQFVREAIKAKAADQVDVLYLTANGRSRLENDQIDLAKFKCEDVTDVSTNARWRHTRSFRDRKRRRVTTCVTS